MRPIIEIRNLSKKYRIGIKQPYYSLRDSLIGFVKNPLVLLKRKKISHDGLANDEFWALKNISFNVLPGEVIGIIGRNGAGKTTLLKLLSRITPPTRGEIILRGRVASLLEVGTGFHPELTGRENIYLNGAILGMKQKEIKKRFDEIVGFSEIEKFLDTPVKHFSSGMYVRLAFAVAAHLDCEILMIDEVLAVGDAQFQQKCLGKMGDIAKQGRTVLFVSHNISMILKLCKIGILFQSGRVTDEGEISKVVNQYLALAVVSTSVKDLNSYQRDGSGKIRVTEFSVCNQKGDSWLYPDQPAIFKMKLSTKIRGLRSSNAIVAIGIDNNFGERLIELHTNFDKAYLNNNFIFGKDITLVCRTKNFPVKPGTYYLTLYVSYSNELCDRLKDVMRVEVKENDFFNTGYLPSQTQGWLLIEQQWNHEN